MIAMGAMCHATGEADQRACGMTAIRLSLRPRATEPDLSEEVTYPGGTVRLFVEDGLRAGARVALSDDQSHYLLRVMRAQAGEKLRLFNGRDGEWLATIAEAGKKRATLACERQTLPQIEVPDLWLVFAPIKRTPADYVTQKATELGVRAMQPVMTRRTIVTRVNVDRMRANAVEAAEQSGRVSVPEIREPVALDKLLASWPPDRMIAFCDEAGDAKPIAEAIASVPALPFAILSGPEGGFEPAERELLRSRNFVLPVTLGNRILRADTAALAALAIWQSVKGDWR
jgi:16S rRNA (uracil1498-N3)-methyltransferase